MEDSKLTALKTGRQSMRASNVKRSCHPEQIIKSKKATYTLHTHVLWSTEHKQKNNVKN